MNTVNIISANKARTTDWDEAGRTCTKCKEYKLWSEFRRRKEVPSGHTSSCKACRNESYSQKERDRRIQSLYDISSEDYNALLEKQNGECAICYTTNPGRADQHFCIDHDHETGRVRGLLCVSCNRALGLFQDDTTILHRASQYLL
jgi:hypothetical protein